MEVNIVKMCFDFIRLILHLELSSNRGNKSKGNGKNCKLLI
jgi:hypothetical protein